MCIKNKSDHFIAVLQAISSIQKICIQIKKGYKLN